MATLGKIVIFDRYGVKEYGPLTGDETIIISYGNTGIVERVFKIYAISKIEGVTEFRRASNSVITIFFVDAHYNNLIMKKFSKSWRENTAASVIIRDIVDNMIGVTEAGLNIELSNYKFTHPFYIPQWTCAETMRWLADRITGTIGKYGYLMYSNSRKLLNFVTIDGLFKSAYVDPDTYVFDTVNINYENTIQAWQSMGVNHMGIK